MPLHVHAKRLYLTLLGELTRGALHRLARRVLGSSAPSRFGFFCLTLRQLRVVGTVAGPQPSR